MELIENIVDDNNHDNIKEFTSYLKNTHNLSFIREHTDEILLFDEDVSSLNIF